MSLDTRTFGITLPVNDGSRDRYYCADDGEHEGCYLFTGKARERCRKDCQLHPRNGGWWLRNADGSPKVGPFK